MISNSRTIMTAKWSVTVYMVTLLSGVMPAYALSNKIVLNETFEGFWWFYNDTAKTLDSHRFADIVASKGTENSKALKVIYQGYERGSERVNMNIPLNQRALHAQLSFDVEFCEGFDFAKGGKLHGLGPEKPITGGKEMKPRGWSARGMWHKDGQLQSYVYHQRKQKQYGDVRRAKDFKFQPGQYYRLQYDVRLNSPADQANGEFIIRVDGEEVIKHQNIQFRAVDSPKSLISQFMFNTFHGGHTPDWAPRKADGSFKTDCAYYDNFEVTLVE